MKTTYQVVPTTEGVSNENQLPPAPLTSVDTKTKDDNGKRSIENGKVGEDVNQLFPETKVYRRRWVMLAIFVVVSGMNAFQWIQFSIITSIIMKYYQVDSQAVNWTSLVYMIAYIPLIFPGAWLMDRVGLRWTLITGAFGTAAGAWIKCLAVAPDRFYVALIGQMLTAVSQVFILGVPSNVAAVWFGPKQVSAACSIGVFGNQLGVALGFLLPPIMVRNHENVEEIAGDLSFMYYSVAGFCSAVFLAVIFGFQSSPPRPPNAARLQLTESLSYFQSMKRICYNRNYILLFITYGINAGVFYAMSTLLNQTVLSHFPGEEENAGRIGLTIVVCGMVGSVMCGVILDRTHKFREITLMVYGLAVLGMCAYSFTFELGYISVTFITAGAVGFFMTGYLPVGFEFAAELTYPEPEVTSSGLLNASAQFFGIIFTIAGDALLVNYSDLVCNGTLSACLLVGAILSFLIRSDLQRQKAHKEVATKMMLSSSSAILSGNDQQRI